jgi:hypothetical protein
MINSSKLRKGSNQIDNNNCVIPFQCFLPTWIFNNKNEMSLAAATTNMLSVSIFGYLFRIDVLYINRDICMHILL